MLKKITNLNNWLILILSPFSILIFLCVLIVRPLFLIRFGEILTYRFGHSLRPVEIHFATKNLEKRTDFFLKKIDIFFFSSISSNKFLKTICKRSVFTLPFQLILTVFEILSWLSTFSNFFKKHLIFMRNYDYDQNNVLDRTKHVLNFTKSEVEKGDSLLEKLGVCKGDKFVCFSTRENNYLKTYLANPNEIFSPWSLRNSNVETYKLAAEELVKLGYKVIRVGKYTEKKITFCNSNIIDYANSEHTSDFLDVYLPYKCEFAFGDSGGWASIPMAFRKHFAMSNWAPYGTLEYYTKKNTFIFKKYYSLDKKKILSLDEIKEADMVDARSLHFKKKNIKLIDSSPDEIKDLVIEVEKKYKGEFHLSEENLQLQEKFKNYIKNNFFTISKHDFKYKMQSSCGTNFLKTINFN